MSTAAAPVAVPGLRRNMVTICAMTATIMQALDTTIANVALPYMQGTLSASQDQINWVLTSYIVAAAIMTAPVGWIANRFGRKRIFILCSGGFTIASVLCGLAQDINQMVLFRLLQGVFGAALVPLSQAVMLDSYALHERAKAMSIWGMGVMMGPIMGPSLGAWLTETYSWHWVFFVNLPFGIFTVLGLLIFMDETRKNRELRFDWFGFAALAVGIGSLQIALDRGEQLGWMESNEIIAEFIISAVGFYYFFAHSFTTAKPFIQFAIFKDKNFIGGCVFMAVMGLVLFSTMALSSPYLQNVIGYPIITAGLLLASRGDDAGRPDDALYRGAHADHQRAEHHLPFAVLHDRLDRPDRRQRDRDHQHRAGFRVRAGIRAALHGGLPDAAQPSAHRRHLDADPDAQRRLLDRHFACDRAADRRLAADLRDPVRAH
jgi:DHA2 family multidrug resistance protein